MKFFKKNKFFGGYSLYIGKIHIWKKIDKHKMLKNICEKLDQQEKLVLEQKQLMLEQQNQINIQNISLENILHNHHHLLCNIKKLDTKNNIMNSVLMTHQNTFKKFKNKFNDKEIVILATGPSLKDYTPIPKAVHIGINHAYKFNKTVLDFLFIQDVSGLKTDIFDINHYEPSRCHKFYGDVLFSEHCAVPESYLIQFNAERYYTGGRGSPFVQDISSCLLPDFGSVVFSALSFALYTNPKKIYLVGCDCSDNGYFDSNSKSISPSLQSDLPNILQGWSKFKAFAEQFYPDTEIVSINPVGLKGLFKEDN